MSKRACLALAAIPLAAGATLAVWQLSGAEVAEAADHTDPPDRSSDSVADIADFFAWHRGTGDSATAVFILTFQGIRAPEADQALTCDRDVLYGIHIDNDGDPTTSEKDIWVRFAEDGAGNCGVQVTGAPGTTAPIEGAVGEALSEEGAMVQAGLFDDPFFFDLEGFIQFEATGELGSFEGLRTLLTPGETPATRDTLMGTNASAVVIEVPFSAASGGGDVIKAWATSSRISS